MVYVIHTYTDVLSGSESDTPYSPSNMDIQSEENTLPTSSEYFLASNCYCKTITSIILLPTLRVLSRIFVLGGKMLKVIVDGGCSHRPQFSRGV